MRREALTGSTAVAVQRPAVASGLLDLQRRGQNSWQEEAFATRAFASPGFLQREEENR